MEKIQKDQVKTLIKFILALVMLIGILIVIFPDNNNPDTKQTSPPTPFRVAREMTPTPFAPLILTPPIRARDDALMSGTVVTSPIYVKIDGRNEGIDLSSPDTFWVIRTDNVQPRVKLGDVTRNIALGNVYFSDEPNLDKILAVEYKANCEHFQKCEWVDITISKGRFYFDRKGKREELLK